MRRFLLAVVLAGCELSPPPAPDAVARLVERPTEARASEAACVVVPEVEALVATERAANPEAFAAFDRIVRRWLDARSPGRDQALLSRWLRDLGKAGAGPMIDLLAVSGFAEPLHVTARASLQTAVTEALARLDDARSAPVLRALFERADAAPVRAAAARGLARACREADLSLLLTHAAHADPLVDAASAGLGRCLRLPAAERLAALLDAAPNADRAAGIATALGVLASDLVWRAPSRRDDPEGEKIRTLAAESLARARVRFPGVHEIDRSIRMIRHPRMAELLEPLGHLPPTQL